MASALLVFKKKIIVAVLEKLEAEMRTMETAAAVAREAATHEESVAEDKYDTRGLEASYLAGAQAKRAAELAMVIAAFKELEVQSYKKSDSIAQTSLVELESDDKKTLFFIAPNGGGISVEVDGKRVQVLTPNSRLGSELMGKSIGDFIELKSGDRLSEYEIRSHS
jgi:transcription elongation GreA/GreB family factor